MCQCQHDPVYEAYCQGRSDFHLGICHIKQTKCPFSEPYLVVAWQEGMDDAMCEMNEQYPSDIPEA